MQIFVHPREKNHCELNQFQELSNNKKKKKERNKSSKQKRRLSRKEMKNLGLYSLPRCTMKYDDYRDLNKLWINYMQQLFGDKYEQLNRNLDCSSAHYDETSSQIHKSDFHGAKIKVVQSKNSNLVGHRGILIMETKETFNILSKDNILRGMIIIRKGCLN